MIKAIDTAFLSGGKIPDAASMVLRRGTTADPPSFKKALRVLHREIGVVIT
jgi:hypothetical protein